MAGRRSGAGGLLRSSAIVSVGVGLSRVTGLVRTAVLAAVIGTTALADGYNLANSTPNVIYDLMLGGVLAATLIPVIVERMEADDQRSIDAIATYVIAALVGVTVLGLVLAPLIVRAYTIFKGDRVAADEQISIAVPLLIMFMPQVLLYGLDTLFTAPAERQAALRGAGVRSGAQQHRRDLHAPGLPPGGARRGPVASRRSSTTRPRSTCSASAPPPASWPSCWCCCRP